MAMHMQYFEALQNDDLSTLWRPRETYAEFMERMPRRRMPVPDDIFGRWELHKYRCTDKACPEHSVDGKLEGPDSPRRCPGCNKPLADAGVTGVGERRAYLGWITGLMEKEESDFFWMTVIAHHADALLMLGAVPIIRQLLIEVAGLRRDLETYVKHPIISVTKGVGDDVKTSR